MLGNEFSGLGTFMTSMELGMVSEAGASDGEIWHFPMQWNSVDGSILYDSAFPATVFWIVEWETDWESIA